MYYKYIYLNKKWNLGFKSVNGQDGLLKLMLNLVDGI